jgi:hypothetical protein
MNQSDLDLTFNMDESFNSIIIVGFLFFGGGLLLSILVPFIVPDMIIRIWWIWIPVIAGYIVFTKMCFNAWRIRNNYVKLDDDTISLHSPENQIEILKWDEIAEIKENNIIERLTLYGPFNKAMNLEYQIKNITELFKILSSKVPHLTNQYSNYREFRRTSQLHLFFGISLVFTTLIVISCVYFGMWFGAIFLGGFSCLLAYVLLTEFICIRLIQDKIVISYLLWQKNYKLSQLDQINLEVVKGGNGKSSPFVILKLNTNKIIKLNAIREGTIALYSAISSLTSSQTS